MEIGTFIMPNHPPERSLREGHEWDLEALEYLDRLGFGEAWIGEHFTSPWEPNPAPDLLIAQALQRTKHIRLGPGGHCMPYHHPVELAHRIAYLDHISKGRLNFGVAASGLPSDWKLFDVDGMSGVNRKMTREALEIILRLWASEEPFEFKGEYWNVNRIGPMLDTLDFHIKPYQKPHPPIGIAGLTPRSDTLEIAGELGFLPMSLTLSKPYLAEHWESVERGAAKTGRTAHRRDWRVVREVYVADSDREARKLALDGMLARAYREYLLPLFGKFGFLRLFKEDPSIADSDVTPEYLVDHGWLVGSPSTVAQKLSDLYGESGGFGTLLVINFDFRDERQAWQASQRLLVEQVLPQFRELKAA